MSLLSQIEQEVYHVVEPLIQHGDSIINPNRVADSVRDRLDPKHATPELLAYLSTMKLRDVVRNTLARDMDQVEKAKAVLADSDSQEEMFEVVLQDYYPAKRDIDGKREGVYIKRELMTEQEVKRQCTRMEKMGASLIRHSKALWEDFRDRQEALRTA